MGEEKALMDLGNRPVLAHAVARFSPQVSSLVVNANGDKARFAPFGCRVIGDAPEFENQGPLAGIVAGLALQTTAGARQMASVPCDAPFLPTDLVSRLLAAGDGHSIVCAQGPRGPEPLFALWPIAILPQLQRKLRQGERKVLDVVHSLPHTFVSFIDIPSRPDPFLNLNRPIDIQLAEQILSEQ